MTLAARTWYGLRHQALQKGPVDLGDLTGGQQSAVPAQAHFDGLRRVQTAGRGPGCCNTS